jgi:predicted transposase/invertase (TIGR01784 family)
LPGVADWNHAFSFNHQTYPDIKVEGLSMRFIELAKRRKLDNFNMENPVDRWLKFLAEPEKLITMQKFDISVYPNLLKATELLDRSNFTIEQQIAYDRHWFAVADINQSNIDSFDRGFDEGMEKGLHLSIAIYKELQSGILSIEEIANKYAITVTEVEKLAKEFE